MRGWEKVLFGLPLRRVHTLVSGLLLAVLLAWLSVLLSGWMGTALLGFDKSPVSSVLVAVVLGMGVGNILRFPGVFKPGLDFTVKKLLRLGIVFLGIRLSLPEVLKVGLLGLPIVGVCIVCAILLTTLLNRLLKLPPRLGTLIGDLSYRTYSPTHHADNFHIPL